MSESLAAKIAAIMKDATPAQKSLDEPLQPNITINIKGNGNFVVGGNVRIGSSSTESQTETKGHKK